MVAMKIKNKVQETDSENKMDEILQQEIEDKEEELRKNKRLNMFVGIFSVLCALAIWLYASAISETEMKFQSIVNIKHVVDTEDKGYEVEYNSDLKINFILNGKVSSISQIPNYGINVFADLSTVNLSEITNTKTVQLPLVFDLPEGVTCIEKSKEYIEVTITKK